MGVQVENLENNMAKLTIEVAAEKVEKAIQGAYLKQRDRIRVPGFRKGKVPRKMIEKMYGEAIFYEEAANTLIMENYTEAAEESGIEIVSRPVVDIVTLKGGEPFVFTAEVAVKPDIELGNYRGVKVTKVDTTVSEEELLREVKAECEKNARSITVEDRAVEDGDTVIIDYEGFADGVAFDGGKGEGQSLKIGSHSFIDTFEEQLIGKNAGDEVEVCVTFPEKYHAKELAGRPAVFQVKIHEIRATQTPELDEDFAQDAGFDTVDEYKEDLRKNLEERKKEQAKREQEDEALGKIIEDSKIELPEPMIETQCEEMINESARRMAGSGLAFEQYLQFSGLTVEQLKDQVRPEAITRIKSRLVLEKIAKTENIEVTDADIEEEIQKMAENYHLDAEKLKATMGEREKKGLTQDIAVEKAVNLVMEHVEEVEKAKKEQEAEENAVSE